MRVQLRSVPLACMGPAQQQVETPSKLVSASEKSCSRRSDAELGQTKSERESQGLLLPPVAAELRGAEEGGQGDAKGPFKTPCLCEDQLSLRPVTMATGPAQCGGRGGEGADAMATQVVSATALMKAEGRALSLLKRQEPLHKLMTCVILSYENLSLQLFDQKKKSRQCP